jgi:hypothetical protein
MKQKITMNNEPTLRDIYDMMVRLNDRMERIERNIESNHDISWSTDHLKTISDWTGGAIVNLDHLSCLFETDNNTLPAFKKCIMFNRETADNELPVRKHKNTVYVLNDDRRWAKWNDENTRLFIQVIWQKFIGLDVNTPPDPSCGDDINLLRRKSVIGMRKTLYDVKKNRAQINAWIGTLAQN